MSKTCLLSASLLVVGLCAAQNHETQSPPPVSVGAEVGAVHVLLGAGGNLAVSIGEDGVLLVDDQFDFMVPGIREVVAELGGGKPTFVLNTHWHYDHTGGNGLLAADGHLIAHHNVRSRLESGGTIKGDFREGVSGAMLPVITYDGEMSIHFNGEEIRLIHVPNAHTDGDTIVWFTGSGVVHMGDIFFAGMLPFIDHDSGGSVQGAIAAIDEVLATVPEDTKVIPGHGPAITSTEDLRGARDLLQRSMSLIAERKKVGADLEQAKAAGLPDDLAALAHPFIPVEFWIETCWKSLEDEG